MGPVRSSCWCLPIPWVAGERGNRNVAEAGGLVQVMGKRALCLALGLHAVLLPVAKSILWTGKGRTSSSWRRGPHPRWLPLLARSTRISDAHPQPRAGRLLYSHPLPRTLTARTSRRRRCGRALANAPSAGDLAGRTLCCAGGRLAGWERKMWVESPEQMRRAGHDDENAFPLSLMTTYHTPFYFLFSGHSFKFNFA